jgi:hypothetical protein
MPKYINTGCLPVQIEYNIAATFSFIAFKSQSLFSPAKIEYRTIVGVQNICEVFYQVFVRVER